MLVFVAVLFGSQMFVKLAVEITRSTSGEHQSDAYHPRIYAIPQEISCNLAWRFPLYGVEADGLLLSVARREKENRAIEP